MILEKEGQVIHGFMTMGSEIRVLPVFFFFFERGITVVVHKTLKKRKMQILIWRIDRIWKAGNIDTTHPGPTIEFQDEFDMIIVAGLAFDLRGYRVGYGGGHFDTLLAKQRTPMKIGICYPFQLEEEVPNEEHDVQVN